MYKLEDLAVAKYEMLEKHCCGISLIEDALESCDVNGIDSFVVSKKVLDKLKDFEASDYKEAIERLGVLSADNHITTREAISIINLIWFTEMRTCAVKQYGSLYLLNDFGGFGVINPKAIATSLELGKDRIRSR